MNKLSSLIKALDKEFSIFIRQRDSDENGWGRCITCGAIKNWKESDNGHFISRAVYATRWNEQNCALQCKRCNGFRGGEQHIFSKEIDRKYGEGTADKLQMKRSFSYKLDRFELQVLIEKYKEINKENK
jgi:hypothetical protein